MKKSFLLLFVFLCALVSEAQVTKSQTLFSIDSLLPSGSAVRMTEVRKAIAKAINFAEPNTVDLRKAGANPNGVTNTTAAIKSAFAQGKSVYVPEGVYLVSDTIKILNNVDFAKGAIFKAASGYTGPIFYVNSAKRLRLNGLHIQGDSTNSNLRGLLVEGLWDSDVNNFFFDCDYRDSTSIGIDIFSSNPVTMGANPWGAFCINILNAHCTRGKHGIRAQKTPGDSVAVTHINIYGGWFSSQKTANILLSNTYNFNIINPAFDNITYTGLKLNNCHQGFFRLGEYNTGVAMEVGDNCSLIDFETALPLIPGMVVGTNYTAKTADRIRLKPTIGNDYYTEYRGENNYNRPFAIVGKAGGGSEIEYIKYQSEQGLVLKTLNPDAAGSNLVGVNSVGGLVKLSTRKMTQGTAAPSGGSWSIGDYCENTAPAPGGYMGWVYTASGWKGYGLIEN